MTSEDHIELPDAGTYVVNSVRSSVQVHSRDRLGRRPCLAVFRFDTGVFTVARPPSCSTVHADLTLTSSRAAPRLLRGGVQVVEAIAPSRLTFQSVALWRDSEGWMLHGELSTGSIVASIDLLLQRLVFDANDLHIVANATLDARDFPTLPGWPTSRRRLQVTVEFAALIQPLPR